MAAFPALNLKMHPAQATSPVQSLRVSGVVSAARRMTVDYELQGDMRSIQLPPPAARPQRCDSLWQHTCFELFVGRVAEPAYLEFNFSPSGDWAAYSFRDYRTGGSALAMQDIGTTIIEQSAERLLLRAHADLSPLCRTWPFEIVRMNVAAVITAADMPTTHWAAFHPRVQPDFHDRSGFRVTFDAAFPCE